MRNSPTAEPSFAARTRWVGTAAICIVLATVSVQAQFQLSQRVAGAADWPEGEVNTGLVLDTNNNCYLTGWFDGTNNFGGSTLTNQSIAGSDIFVAKYNSTGALQWAQRAGGTGINYGRAAGVDSNGSIYVTGGYQGPASFGGVNLPVTSGEQFFLAKYSSSGSVQWVKTSTNGSDDNYGIGLTVDGAGNSYALAVMDHSGASLTFGSITVTTTKLGYTLLVLVKYDNAGTAQWVRLFDSTAETYGSKLAADASGNVYVRGSFDSDMTIGSSNLVVSSGSTMNMFIAKFSSAGNLIWVQTPQGGDVGEGGVAVDAGANVYVSGAFDTNLNFGGGIILTNLAVFGDAFLAKYNSAGAIQWAKAAGGTNGGFYWDVALDGATNVYAAGFLGQFAAVAKYNSAGAPQWVYSATGLPGDPVASTATKCAVDAAGHCYLAGAYQGVAAFWTNALGPQDSWNFFLAEATTNPAVQFTANPNGGTVPLTVQFNSGSTDNQGNTISTWRWNFGDGGVSSLQNPSHTYTNVGTFYPGFIATNNHGVAVLGYGAPVSTWTPSAADFTYITNNGGLTVTGYIGSNSQVIIPSTANGWPVTAIGDGAFQYLATITSVTIPSSVSSIGNEAFAACDGLTSVTIPNSVIIMGIDAFGDCNGLTSITLPTNLSSIADFLFTGCSGLTGITIPASVTNIGSFAFQGCSGLTSLFVPAGVATIGDGAFASCFGLTAITVAPGNASFVSIGGIVFSHDHTILVIYPTGNAATSYVIPNSVLTVGGGAFYSCYNLTTVSIPNSVINIGDSAFTGCNGLTSLTLGAGVESLGDYSFFSCFGLTNVIIPNNVGAIGYQAFAFCDALTNVTIGTGAIAIAGDAFGACSSLTTITVAAQNPAYSSVNGVLFDKAQTTLVQFPAGLGGSYAVPNSVTDIASQAFDSCNALTNVTIGNGVTTIEDEAFWACHGLIRVFLGTGIAYAGNDAFFDCTSLTAAYFQGNAPPDSGTAFEGDALATVYYLPGTVGWAATFGGAPTHLFTASYPLILSNDSRFGVHSNHFGFTISWATNRSVVVQACTDLAHPAWTPIATNPLIGGTSFFTDPNWTNYAKRFYRVTTQ